jgi:hypothetical protein
LGGSDDDSNLWAQPRRSIEPVWNAERKDDLEARLCQMVCSGQLDLETAQREIAGRGLKLKSRLRTWASRLFRSNPLWAFPRKRTLGSIHR